MEWPDSVLYKNECSATHSMGGSQPKLANILFNQWLKILQKWCLKTHKFERDCLKIQCIGEKVGFFFTSKTRFIFCSHKARERVRECQTHSHTHTGSRSDPEPVLPYGLCNMVIWWKINTVSVAWHSQTFTQTHRKGTICSSSEVQLPAKLLSADLGKKGRETKQKIHQIEKKTANMICPTILQSARNGKSKRVYAVITEAVNTCQISLSLVQVFRW